MEAARETGEELSVATKSLVRSWTPCGLPCMPPFHSKCYFHVSEPTNVFPRLAGISAEKPYRTKKTPGRGWWAGKAELATSP